MTDYELNRSIAAALGIPVPSIDEVDSDPNLDIKNDRIIKYDGADKVFFKYLNKDYCNNWNDLMPLIVEHGISLLDPEYAGTIPSWKALSFNPSHFKTKDNLNENPQRALAECLLKVLQYK